MNYINIAIPYITIAAISFLVNIPFGFIRANTAKFSAKWLLWIHASIPIIVYFRVLLKIDPIFIPVCVYLAILGQIVGSRMRQKAMTVQDKNRLNQIPDLDVNQANRGNLSDFDVMIVLLNMGGPRNIAGVRDFLRRIFLDPYIIRFPLSKILQPFFAWLIVKIRGKEAEERYKLIGGGSPIFESTRKQTEALKKELNQRGRRFDVVFSFNYSEPLPEETITEIKTAGKHYILPVSLYPHYSAATTGSNLHYLKKEAQLLYPELKFLNPPSYYLHDSYIDAFIDRINEQLHPGESLADFYLIFSAHGLPLYFLTEGDPYPFQIAQTIGRILGKLDRHDSWVTCYQSDVGPLQWLKPSTENVLKSLAKKSIKKVIVVPISFVTDHIETTCEINMEYKTMANELGIDDFRMTKALECHHGLIKALADSVERVLPQDTQVESFSDNFFTSVTEASHIQERP